MTPVQSIKLIGMDLSWRYPIIDLFLRGKMDPTQNKHFLSCQSVRKVDQYAIEVIGIEGLILMENAARGCADLLSGEKLKGSVAVVCGRGNNGGDGFAIVRHLLVRHIPARAILIGDPIDLKGDALTNYEYLCSIAPDSVISITDPQVDPENLAGLLASFEGHPTEWIVDALLGTGTQGQIRSPFKEVIATINDLNKKVLAVDIPSGLDGDSGQSLGETVRATATATFVAQKLGFREAAAGQYLGQVHVLDIGVPDSVISAAMEA